MGDRVSISFRNSGEESVTLFNHWGGMEFVKTAEEYAANLATEKAGQQVAPLDRLEPHTVMVDFIRAITKEQHEVRSSLYLGRSAADGDNSDNGHHVIELVCQS